MNDELIEKLERLPEGESLEFDGATYIKLDSSKKIDTSICNHVWSVDEVIGEKRHWVCNKCGLGKYCVQKPGSIDQ